MKTKISRGIRSPKRFIGISLITSISLFTNNTVKAQSNQCNAQIEEIKSAIQSKHGVNVIELSLGRISNQPYSPYNVSGELKFTLDGSRGSDLMNSTQLLRSYANSIMKNCDEVVRVKFGLNKSDWLNSYSWMKNVGARSDECVEPQRHGNYSLQWGQQVCL